LPAQFCGLLVMEPTNSMELERLAATRESQTRGRQQVISVMESPRGTGGVSGRGWGKWIRSGENVLMRSLGAAVGRAVVRARRVANVVEREMYILMGSRRIVLELGVNWFYC
jgi:hypothetical protein